MSLNIKSRQIGQKNKRKRDLSSDSECGNRLYGVDSDNVLESNKLILPLKPLSETKILKKLSISKLINHQSLKMDSTVDKNSSTNDLILKYFKSISKQIGHLNSQVILNTAELRDIKQYVKKNVLVMKVMKMAGKLLMTIIILITKITRLPIMGKKKKKNLNFHSMIKKFLSNSMIRFTVLPNTVNDC